MVAHLLYGRRGSRTRKNRRINMIHTVFPKDENEIPQDFPTYAEAKEYGDEEFGENGYTIEPTDGDCI